MRLLVVSALAAAAAATPLFCVDTYREAPDLRAVDKNLERQRECHGSFSTDFMTSDITTKEFHDGDGGSFFSEHVSGDLDIATVLEHIFDGIGDVTIVETIDGEPRQISPEDFRARMAGHLAQFQVESNDADNENDYNNSPAPQHGDSETRLLNAAFIWVSHNVPVSPDMVFLVASLCFLFAAIGYHLRGKPAPTKSAVLSSVFHSPNDYVIRLDDKE